MIAGFAMAVVAGSLTPALGLGVLFAQSTLWRPTTLTVPAAGASQFSYLAYNTTTGLYWTNNANGNTAGDAVLGWAQANATQLVAVSNQDIAVVIDNNSSTGATSVFPSSLPAAPSAGNSDSGGANF